jgi:hypothetical protein
VDRPRAWAATHSVLRSSTERPFASVCCYLTGMEKYPQIRLAKLASGLNGSTKKKPNEMRPT